MKSKLAILAVVVTLFSLPYAFGQTDSEPEEAKVVRDLRREVTELKQRIAELEARLARIEALEKRLLREERDRPHGNVLPFSMEDEWNRIPGSYLRFPAEVERAMMGDPGILPRKLDRRMQMQPFAPQAMPEVRPQH